MIGALGHADHVAQPRLGIDELGLRVVALGHVDGERELGGIDRRVADRAVDPQRAGGERAAARSGPRRPSEPLRSRWRDRRRRARRSRPAGSGEASAAPASNSTISGCEPSASACAAKMRQRKPAVERRGRAAERRRQAAASPCRHRPPAGSALAPAQGREGDKARASEDCEPLPFRAPCRNRAGAVKPAPRASLVARHGADRRRFTGARIGPGSASAGDDRERTRHERHRSRCSAAPPLRSRPPILTGPGPTPANSRPC